MSAGAVRIARMALSEVTVRALPGRAWLLLEVTDGDGERGLAEATLGARNEAVEAALADAFARLGGRAVAPGEVARALGVGAGAAPPDRVAATVVSALETALEEIAARRVGVSLAAALGSPRRERVPLYANVNRSLVEDRSPEAFARAAAAAAGEGFATVKCAPFDEVTADLAPGAALERAAPGLARLRAVRDAIGPGVALLVDCHSRFPFEAALRIAPALRELAVGWYEEPLDPLTDAPALARVAAEAGLWMAGGEMGYGAERLAAIAREARLDVVMPDGRYCGGVRELVRVESVARAAGVRWSPHSPGSPVNQLASAHGCAVVPEPLPLEYAWGEVPWRAALLDPPERVERGELVLPAGPGLGARLNAGTVRQHGRSWFVGERGASAP